MGHLDNVIDTDGLTVFLGKRGKACGRLKTNQNVGKNKTQTTAAHQPGSYELHEYLEFQDYLMEVTDGEIGTTPIEGMDKEREFQTYLLKNTIVEIGTISIEGMDNPMIYFYMTVYVRTINGKTISIKCEKRQRITRIKDETERKTKMPKAL